MLFSTTNSHKLVYLYPNVAFPHFEDNPAPPTTPDPAHVYCKLVSFWSNNTNTENISNINIRNWNFNARVFWMRKVLFGMI